MLSCQTCPNEHTSTGLGETACLVAVPSTPAHVWCAAIILNRIRLA